MTCQFPETSGGDHDPAGPLDDEEPPVAGVGHEDRLDQGRSEAAAFHRWALRLGPQRHRADATENTHGYGERGAGQQRNASAAGMSDGHAEILPWTPMVRASGSLLPLAATCRSNDRGRPLCSFGEEDDMTTATNG